MKNEAEKKGPEVKPEKKTESGEEGARGRRALRGGG